jgi:hypothetical protein
MSSEALGRNVAPCRPFAVRPACPILWLSKKAHTTPDRASAIRRDLHAKFDFVFIEGHRLFDKPADLIDEMTLPGKKAVPTPWEQNKMERLPPPQTASNVPNSG